MLLPLDYLRTEIRRRHAVFDVAATGIGDGLPGAAAGASRATVPCADAADAALRGLRARFGLALGFALGVGILCGAGTVHGVSGGNADTVNIALLLLTLLGPHAAALVLWSVAAIAALGRLAPVPGWIAERGLRAWQHLRKTAASAPAAAVLADFLLRTPSGRLRLALLTHLLWLGLLLGASGACWTWFAFRQVDFHWGTTVLEDATVSAALQRLSGPVASAGFAVPGRSAILGSRLGNPLRDGAATRRRWGFFVVGALIVYGLMPRLAALTLTLTAMVLADRRLRRRPADPVMRNGIARQVLDADTPTMQPPEPVLARQPLEPLPAAAAWLALERPVPPVAAPGVELGLVTDRAGQATVLARVAREAAWPALVVGVERGVTPDRGLERFLTELVRAAACPVFLYLHDDRASATWPVAERHQRVLDWRSLAQRAGVLPSRVHPDLRA